MAMKSKGRFWRSIPSRSTDSFATKAKRGRVCSSTLGCVFSYCRVCEAVDGQHQVSAQDNVMATVVSTHKRPTAEHTANGMRPLTPVRFAFHL
jgi:hypothetical protein